MRNGLDARLHGRKLLEVAGVERQRLNRAFVDPERHLRRGPLHDGDFGRDFDDLANLTQFEGEVDYVFAADGEMQITSQRGPKARPFHVYLVVAGGQLRLRVLAEFVRRHTPLDTSGLLPDRDGSIG